MQDGWGGPPAPPQPHLAQMLYVALLAAIAVVAALARWLADGRPLPRRRADGR